MSHKTLITTTYLTSTRTSSASQSDAISNSGGFIAMAAGLSIVIPLVCVFVVQVRRAKLAERAIARADALARESGSVRDPALDLPPAYEQVFGPNFRPISVSVVQPRSDNLDVLIQDNEARGNETRETEGRLANIFSNYTPSSLTGEMNDSCIRDTYQLYIQRPDTDRFTTYTNESLSITSGSCVEDNHSTSSTLHSHMSVTNSHRPTNGTEITAINPLQTQNINNSNSNHVNISSDQSSSSLSTSSSSFPSVPRFPRLNPFLTLPSTMHNQGKVHDNAAPENRHHEDVPSPYPGRHISVEEYISSTRGSEEDPELPPPSYEQAMQILDSTKVVKNVEKV